MNTHIQVLGSTSAGNSTIIWNENDFIMVDCGFSQRYTVQNLDNQNLQIENLSGVLITHTHTDHIHESMLTRLLKLQIPLYCHEKTKKWVLNKYPSLEDSFEDDSIITFDQEPFSVGSFTVKGFEVPHDSPGGCFGYNIYTSEQKPKKVSISTDLGFPGNSLYNYFTDSDVIILESNHDLDMLNDSQRPSWLKRRIRKIGHLSNEQCAEFLKQILENSTRYPKAIILAHISQECNTNEHAVNSIESMLNLNQYSDIEIIQTYKRQANTVLTF